jgi:hypothetical protein
LLCRGGVYPTQNGLCAPPKVKATSKPKTARFELLQIQQRLWRRLQREIKATIADNPPNVEIYKEEYERDLRRYDSISSKEDLVRACKAARVVYLGDYHTLPQAQKTLVKLLLALCGTRKEIVLCMEMVHIKHQEHLDAYMERRLDDKGFLAAIDYEGTWGFPWQPYREIFAVARRRKLRVVGINSDPQEHEHDHLLERDFRTAKVVATHLDANPNALVIVFDGDLHVARDHLPFIVANYVEYELRKDAPKQVIIHQNAEAVYWRLAEERREREINVVRLSDDSFCVLNASPIEKLHSYMNWVMERDALQPLVESSWGLIEDDEDWEDDNDLEYSEQVHNLVTSVADFLEIKRDDLDSFHVFTVNDLDFLDSIGGGDVTFNEQELSDIKRQILSNESYFIPKGDIIYLADFSVVNAAEEATHFLHHRCSGYDWDQPRSLSVDFYFRVMTETLGFFGSKVLVPTRECWRELDCKAFVDVYRAKERERSRRRRGSEGKKSSETGALAAVSEERVKLLLSQKLTLTASKLVLAHKENEREFIADGTWAGAGIALTQDTEVHLLLTHMLGHMLGDKLYWGLVTGVVNKATVRDLFHAPLEEEGVALRRYLEFVALLDDVEHDGARGDRL